MADTKCSEINLQISVTKLIDSLSTHRINTLTELCRIERIAATCEDEVDARAFQRPITAAWTHYVASHQFLTELRGLTRDYPFCSEIVSEALGRVRSDPRSNRSWNLAWLCLVKMRDDGLVATYATWEAAKPEMWGDETPTSDQLVQLATCFETSWMTAIVTMLRHWSISPTWY